MLDDGCYRARARACACACLIWNNNNTHIIIAIAVFARASIRFIHCCQFSTVARIEAKKITSRRRSKEARNTDATLKKLRNKV